MPKQFVNPAELVKPRGFNHGVVTTGGRILFLAGQDGSNSEGRIAAPGDLVAQFEQTLNNLRAVVEAAGGTTADVIKLNIFVKDRDDYKANLKPLGAAWQRVFGKEYPAMALFEVGGFFNDEALVELEGFAHLEDD